MPYTRIISIKSLVFGLRDLGDTRRVTRFCASRSLYFCSQRGGGTNIRPLFKTQQLQLRDKSEGHQFASRYYESEQPQLLALFLTINTTAYFITCNLHLSRADVTLAMKVTKQNARDFREVIHL